MKLGALFRVLNNPKTRTCQILPLRCYNAMATVADVYSHDSYTSSKSYVLKRDNKGVYQMLRAKKLSNAFLGSNFKLETRRHTPTIFSFRHW